LDCRSCSVQQKHFCYFLCMYVVHCGPEKQCANLFLTIILLFLYHFAHLETVMNTLQKHRIYLLNSLILIPNELVLTFGGLHLCVQFGENRRRNATVRVMTDGQTDRQTHRRKPILLSVPSYAIAMGQIITLTPVGNNHHFWQGDASYISHFIAVVC